MTQGHSLFCWKKVTSKRCCIKLRHVCIPFSSSQTQTSHQTYLPRVHQKNALPAIFWRALYFQHKSSLEIISFLFSRLFLSFSLVSLHFAWCNSYLKKLEAMRNPGETSEARVQSETTSKGRFCKISFQVQSAKINLPLSDLVATTWA